MHIPKAIIYVLMVLAILAMIPPALIARTRAVHSAKRRIHLIQDMDNQPKFRAQAAATALFADGRAMRPPVADTIARGNLNDDDHLNRGVVKNASATGSTLTWATTFPASIPLTMQLMHRGQERFTIYCRPCHGDSGHGDGIVNKRANQLLLNGVNGTVWVAPKNIHEELIRTQPPGQIFNTITHGIRTMAGYESQIPVEDRWAIVAYVKALQRSQHARIEDVPAEERSNLPLIPLPAKEEETPAGSGATGTKPASTPPAGAGGSKP